MEPIPSILFVCMGNICRSPTAEGVLRQRAAAAGLALHIDSAGTHAYHVGEAPDARSARHAAQRGYDLTQQRARQVSADDFERFDLLLAMDRDNLELLQRACPPELRHKLGLFMQYARNHRVLEVPDPYYGGVQGFDQVLDYIEDAADGLIRDLRAHPTSQL
ncbi:low molecular weight phosphotyrosine protein phosphatase [Massilia sp. MB5]|uniref:low molecular weight protein-tyrosine-phosphatase n=1 Tax=unclassified Massilia TaxID=2609279 RepID=UPI00067C8838|nr:MULTISPECIES: low molecular weight protein-tyrosine-phosphatase [unclassified Massilia]AKU20705.1 phosphotyrosine protein phosphatase [Massilia sp. NR 4-1]UMR29808.1 low molecular weight phosphotyrosine protein phosphatase [Massilia sp. MB5]